MNANQLRASILQMAIEGKLVPQLDSEPAVEQLGNAPEDVPFEIPEKWKWVQIRTLGKTTTGSTPPKNNPNYYGNDIPFVNPGDIQDSKITFRSEGLSNEARSLARIVSPFSILMVCIGGCIGKCAISSISTSFNQQINALTPDEVHSHKLIFYFLISQYFQNEVKQLSTGTATPIINKNKWSSIYIPLPPLEEQKRIVAKLEQLLPLVDEYGKAYEKLEELNAEFPDKLKASVLQSAIKGQLVPQLDSEPAVEQIGKAPEDLPFDIPEKWTFVKLSNISVKVHYGYTASAADNGNYKLLRITDISSGYVNWDTVPFCHVDEKAISKMKLAQNDLVIARSGSVGKAYLIKEINCDAVFASYLIRVIPKFELVYPKYLEIFCNSPFYWKQIQKSSSGSVQLNVNAKSLSNLDIPLPPLEEQKRIVAKVEELFALIDAMKK